jgi:hypothetical protein
MGFWSLVFPKHTYILTTKDFLEKQNTKEDKVEGDGNSNFKRKVTYILGNTFFLE